MRFLMSALLAIMLAVTMPLALTGAASAEASPMDSMADATVSPVGHECCTPQQDTMHGDCAACAAIGHAEISLIASRISLSIRHDPITQAMKSATARLPLPPPRPAII